MDFILEGIAKAFVLLLQGDPETYSAVWTKVQAASISMTASLLLGIPLGRLLCHLNFPDKKAEMQAISTKNA